jgi:hypothetical protein
MNLVSAGCSVHVINVSTPDIVSEFPFAEWFDMFDKALIDIGHMDWLTVFGLLAVSLMLLFYTLEKRSPLFVVAFAGSCLMASVYGFAQGAWPFGLVEGVWSLVAIRRWKKSRIEPRPAPPVYPSNADNFFAELRAIAHPAGRGDYKFLNADGSHLGFAQFIIDSTRRVAIHRLWTLKPGQGSGSKILGILCDVADRHDVELMLKVIPIGRVPHPMTSDQLFEWYQRHGFVGTKRKMIRTPVISWVNPAGRLDGEAQGLSPLPKFSGPAMAKSGGTPARE